jgi:hypothetical protein
VGNRNSMRNKFGGWLLLALTLPYIMMLGGGLYEQLNITAKIASAPPQSLAMMQGSYGFNPIKFWVLLRPITILLFLISLATLWKSNVRSWLLIAFSIDLLVTLSTYLYFAPETGFITSVPFSNTVDSVIQQRAQLWENLNWLRLSGFFVGSVFLLKALSKVRTASR